jgi:type VI secretion system protein ImpB
VIGDFSGNPENPLPKIKDSKFVNVDGDNFDDVMKGMAPRVTYRVENKLTPAGGEFAVELNFRSIEDFRPEAVVEQVDPLRKLLEARSKLADLRNKLAGNDKLEDILQDVLSNTEKLMALSQQSAKKE